MRIYLEFEIPPELVREMAHELSVQDDHEEVQHNLQLKKEIKYLTREVSIGPSGKIGA
jgi:hypothetical protein